MFREARECAHLTRTRRPRARRVRSEKRAKTMKKVLPCRLYAHTHTHTGTHSTLTPAHSRATRKRRSVAVAPYAAYRDIQSTLYLAVPYLPCWQIGDGNESLATGSRFGGSGARGRGIRPLPSKHTSLRSLTRSLARFSLSLSLLFSPKTLFNELVVIYTAASARGANGNKHTRVQQCVAS